MTQTDNLDNNGLAEPTNPNDFYKMRDAESRLRNDADQMSADLRLEAITALDDIALVLDKPLNLALRGIDCPVSQYESFDSEPEDERNCWGLNFITFTGFRYNAERGISEVLGVGWENEPEDACLDEYATSIGHLFNYDLVELYAAVRAVLPPPVLNRVGDGHDDD